MLEQIPFVRGVLELVEDGGPFVALIFAAGVLMWAIIADTRSIPARRASRPTS